MKDVSAVSATEHSTINYNKKQSTRVVANDYPAVADLFPDQAEMSLQGTGLPGKMPFARYISTFWAQQVCSQNSEG